MPSQYDYNEMMILRLIELNSLIPHYWSEFLILSFQLLDTDQQKLLKKRIQEIESMVLEEDSLYNVYRCDGPKCLFKFKTKRDWYDITHCPKCGHKQVSTVIDRLSLYDIEMAMESNNDYNAFFVNKGVKVTKFDVERKLNKIKQYVFNIIRETATKRRFKRAR